ncbi:hypothetical protein ELI_1496 [Eubacterium callanderi]|uniref:Uncharacterized protein n=1 Tax=Eubacterium callanderi TaxID=53442 RepID=E3GLW1_9FIRM|nr:hypothetical protein ELI_1496 [Eubacterium callanderi]
MEKETKVKKRGAFLWFN